MSASLATAPDVATIVAATAKVFGLAPRQITSRAMSREVLEARAIAMHVARRLTKQSLPAIGRRFRRHHSVVMDCDRRVEALASAQPEVRRRVEAVADAVRVGGVDQASLAAARLALGERAGEPAPPRRTAEDNEVALASARVWRRAEAAAEAWRRLAQAQFTPGERAARAAFEAAMKTLSTTLETAAQRRA